MPERPALSEAFAALTTDPRDREAWRTVDEHVRRRVRGTYAEDVSQETLVTAALTPPERPRAAQRWLCRVIESRHVDLYRAQGRASRTGGARGARARLVLTQQGVCVGRDYEPIEDRLSCADGRAVLDAFIAAVLDSVPEPFRCSAHAALLRTIYGLGAREIAEALSCQVSDACIWKRVSRGRERVLTALDSLPQDDALDVLREELERGRRPARGRRSTRTTRAPHPRCPEIDHHTLRTRSDDDVR
jgi:DNA-directed RNA polymerase specialized sigma24 family protein